MSFLDKSEKNVNRYLLKEESGGSGIFDGYDIDSTIVLLEIVG